MASTESEVTARPNTNPPRSPAPPEPAPGPEQVPAPEPSQTEATPPSLVPPPASMPEHVLPSLNSPTSQAFAEIADAPIPTNAVPDPEPAGDGT